MFEEFDFSFDIYTQLKRGQVVEGKSPHGGVSYRLDPEACYLATAIHAGQAVRPDVLKYVKLSKRDRLYEEDPKTDDFIADLPCRMTILDSRFEYDVNRPSHSAIALKKEWAWGLQVFHNDLPTTVELLSRRKFLEYYLALEAWAEYARDKFGGCVVYDMHSYNIARQVGKGIPDPPVFNLGTGNDSDEFVRWRQRWRPALDDWMSALQSVTIPGVETTVEENRVFKGLGEQARVCRRIGDNVLCLPTEVSKIYMDEDSLEYFPDRIAALRKQFGTLIPQHAQQAVSRLARPRKRRTPWLESLTPVDSSLFEARALLDILKYVNPENRSQELQRYLADPDTFSPQYSYASLQFSPSAFRTSLQAVPIQRIEDPELATMYEALRTECTDLLGLIEARETHRFLELSLKMYPAPSQEELGWAEEILEQPFELAPRDVSPDRFVERLQRKIVIESRRYAELAAYEVGFGPISSDAAFRSGRLEVRDGAWHSDIHVSNQECHEVYSHVFTWHNGLKQPLSIFRNGMPGSTVTQEGLGALCEFICGFFPQERIRVLAARWVGAHRLVSGDSFAHTAAELVERFHFDREEAFTIANRLWRGPGFTKDVIYAQGLKQVVDYWQGGGSLDRLFLGKVGLHWLPLIERLLKEGKLVLPYCLPGFLDDAENLAQRRKALAGSDNILAAAWSVA